VGATTLLEIARPPDRRPREPRDPSDWCLIDSALVIAYIDRKLRRHQTAQARAALLCWVDQHLQECLRSLALAGCEAAMDGLREHRQDQELPD